MKNKFTKILSLALVSILCLGVFTACPVEEEEAKQVSMPTTCNSARYKCIILFLIFVD